MNNEMPSFLKNLPFQILFPLHTQSLVFKFLQFEERIPQSAVFEKD